MFMIMSKRLIIGILPFSLQGDVGPPGPPGSPVSTLTPKKHQTGTQQSSNHSDHCYVKKTSQSLILYSIYLCIYKVSSNQT